MSYLLKKLSSKQEIDDVVRSTEDLVLVLRFGRDSDLTCMQLDEIVSCCNLRVPVIYVTVSMSCVSCYGFWSLSKLFSSSRHHTCPDADRCKTLTPYIDIVQYNKSVVVCGNAK